MSETMYYLQNTSMNYCGNSPYWWAKEGHGYTLEICDAELMTLDEAERIVQNTRGSHTWFKWSFQQVKHSLIEVVDMQKLRKQPV